MPGSTVSLNIAVREKSFTRSVSVFDEPMFSGSQLFSTEPLIPQPTGSDVIGPPVPIGSEILLRQSSSNLNMTSLGGVVQSNSFSSSFPFGFPLEESSSLAKIGTDALVPQPGSFLPTFPLSPEPGSLKGGPISILDDTRVGNFDQIDLKIKELYASMNKKADGFEEIKPVQNQIRPDPEPVPEEPRLTKPDTADHDDAKAPELDDSDVTNDDNDAISDVINDDDADANVGQVLKVDMSFDAAELDRDRIDRDFRAAFFGFHDDRFFEKIESDDGSDKVRADENEDPVAEKSKEKRKSVIKVSLVASMVEFVAAGPIKPF